MDFDRPTLRQRFRHFTGQPVDFDLRPFRELVAEVTAMEAGVEALDDEDIRNRAQQLRGGNVGEATVEIFALVREASKRRLGQRPYDEEI